MPFGARHAPQRQAGAVGGRSSRASTAAAMPASRGRMRTKATPSVTGVGVTVSSGSATPRSFSGSGVAGTFALSGAAVRAGAAVSAGAAVRRSRGGREGRGGGLRLARPRHRRERKRLAGERHQRLRGHPDRRLAARARVADGAAAGHERAQVAERAARAAVAHPRGIAARRQQALDRPGGGLRVARTALQREASVRVLTRDEPGRRAPGDLRAALPGRGERLQGGAGVVGAGRAALAGEVEAAVLVGLRRDEGGCAADRRAARRLAGRAQGEHGERRRVHAPGEAAVGLLPGGELVHEVAAAGVARVDARGPQRQDRAGPLPQVAAQRARVRADVRDEAMAVARDVARVLAGCGEAERRPAGVHLGRAGAGRGAEPAVAVLGVLAGSRSRAGARRPRRAAAGLRRRARGRARRAWRRSRGPGARSTSKRVRKRCSARASAGPNARQNAMLPSTCAMSNGNEVAKIAPSFAHEWSPEYVIQSERFMTMP